MIVGLSQVLEILRNMRIQHWRGYWGMALVGFLLNLNVVLIIHWAWMGPALQFAILTSLFLAFTFAINNCFDAPSDALDVNKQKNNPIASGKLSKQVALISCILLAGFAVMLAGFWLWTNIPCLAIYGILLLLGAAYSVPPLRLKAVPIADLVSHGLFFGCLLFIFGSLLLGPLMLPQIVLLVPIFFYSVTLELRNHIDDFEVDATAGVQTTAVWLGKKKSQRLLLVLLITTLTFSLFATLLIWTWINLFWLLPLLGLVSVFAWYRTSQAKWLRLSDFLMVALFTTVVLLTLIPTIIISYSIIIGG